MALVINPGCVAAELLGAGVRRQRLLTEERVPGSRVRLDRWAIGPGASVSLEVPAGNLAWFQMLEGEAVSRGVTLRATDALNNTASARGEMPEPAASGRR